MTTLFNYTSSDITYKLSESGNSITLPSLTYIALSQDDYDEGVYIISDLRNPGIYNPAIQPGYENVMIGYTIDGYTGTLGVSENGKCFNTELTNYSIINDNTIVMGVYGTTDTSTDCNEPVPDLPTVSGTSGPIYTKKGKGESDKSNKTTYIILIIVVLLIIVVVLYVIGVIYYKKRKNIM